MTQIKTISFLAFPFNFFYYQQDNYFKMNLYDGKITTTKPLDYEAKSSFVLQIIVMVSHDIVQYFDHGIINILQYFYVSRMS